MGLIIPFTIWMFFLILLILVIASPWKGKAVKEPDPNAHTSPKTSSVERNKSKRKSKRESRKEEPKEEQKEEQEQQKEQTESKNNDDDTTYGVVIADSNLRVRSSASTNGDVLEKLSGGEIFDVIEAGADWLKIETPAGTTGYVSTEFVSLRTGKKPATKSILPAPSSKGEEIVSYAKQFLGTPYVWAGTDLNSGVDCSGFVYSVMKNFGVSLNRSSASMTANGVPVEKSELAAGDLVFFDSDRNGGISHVGIYIGDNQYIHSSSGASSGVIISNLTDSYSASTYVTARRVLK